MSRQTKTAAKSATDAATDDFYTPDKTNQEGKMVKQNKISLSLALTLVAFAFITSLLIAVIVIMNVKPAAETVKDSTTTSATTDETDSGAEMAVLGTTYTTEQMTEFLDSGGCGFVYIGRPTCSWCQKFTPLLNAAIEKLALTGVIYYNTDEVAAADASTMMDRINAEGTPTFIYFENGVEVARMTDSERQDQAAIEAFLTKYQPGL
jgi:predicted bacteriocin transport accessory protein